jgi:hypothetical protein
MVQLFRILIIIQITLITIIIKTLFTTVLAAIMDLQIIRVTFLTQVLNKKIVL